MNFLCQAFEKLLYYRRTYILTYRQTSRQTDATKKITMTLCGCNCWWDHWCCGSWSFMSAAHHKHSILQFHGQMHTAYQRILAFHCRSTPSKRKSLQYT